MSIFDDAETDIQRHHGRRVCALTLWMRTLEESDAARIRQLLAEPEYTSRALSRYLATKGVRINDQVLSRHRSGKCCGQ